MVSGTILFRIYLMLIRKNHKFAMNQLVLKNFYSVKVVDFYF